MPASAIPSLWTTRYGVAAAVGGNDPVVRSLRVYGEWAEHETDLLSGLLEEGHTVLELGGDYAAHAMWMARAVGATGQVHVVEPRRIRFQQLCANVALNGLDNVFAHPLWLGRTNGKIALTAGGEQEQVRMATLDSLALDALHLIKVNLTHALVEAVAGAAETLRVHRPLIYARLSGMEHAADEVAALKSAGYRVWSHLPYLFNVDNHAGATENIFPGLVHQNIVAAPADAPFSFGGRMEL
ncbi:hypothetical protein L2Y94_08245 [Luteibacter aegosomatis]|uniref:hypothetical protein n=1 Tax=Luteibacter aegosomatis TaxID=2911537 RepID=UPI001FFA907B|nr:hypothetical protein [Luteibacter aegosomatis]UPG87330.1 hypothetical protein L2Y94_08245 [Luteibacter aegosomatis]